MSNGEGKTVREEQKGGTSTVEEAVIDPKDPLGSGRMTPKGGDPDSTPPTNDGAAPAGSGRM
jgi:hypothetical protein